MKDAMQQLLIRQLTAKMKPYESISDIGKPSRGWIYCIRSTLGMSLRQLGDRLNMTSRCKEIRKQ